MRHTIRRLWTTSHRWLALSLGWLLALQALVGALLTVAKPLDHWIHPELFTQPASSATHALSLEALRKTLVAEFGPKADLRFRPPEASGESVSVRISGAWKGTVFFDNAGRELGRRGQTEGFANFLLALHRNLLLGDTGKALLAALALCYICLLASGLVLWWPLRGPPSFRIRLDRGHIVTLSNLHRTVGVLLGLFMAISVSTGAYLAWPPLSQAISRLAGTSPYKPAPLHMTEAATPRLPVDTLSAEAQALFPGATLSFIQVPGQANKPVVVRLKLADDPHPIGLSTVWLHPMTGEVIKAMRWDQLDAGKRYLTVLYPLHTGELGGWPLTLVVAIVGLAITLLFLTGLGRWGLRQWTQSKQRWHRVGASKRTQG